MSARTPTPFLVPTRFLVGTLALALVVACGPEEQGGARADDPAESSEQAASSYNRNWPHRATIEFQYRLTGRVGCASDQYPGCGQDLEEIGAIQALVTDTLTSSTGVATSVVRVVDCGLLSCAPVYFQGPITQIKFRVYLRDNVAVPADRNSFLSVSGFVIQTERCASARVPGCLFADGNSAYEPRRMQELFLTKPDSFFPSCDNSWSERTYVEPAATRCSAMDYMYRSPATQLLTRRTRNVVVSNAGGTTEHWHPTGRNSDGSCSATTNAECWWGRTGGWADGSSNGVANFRFVARRAAETTLAAMPAVAFPGLDIVAAIR